MEYALLTMHSFRTFVIVVIALCVPAIASAARVSIELPHDSARLKKTITMYVVIDTERESINAFEGKVAFPSDLLSLREIRDGESMVSIWVEKPHEDEEGVISFSGITPGGYQGDHGILFSAVFEAKEEGEGIFALSHLSALKNDGAGTSARVSSVSSHFSVSANGNESPLENRDVTPPEPFSLAIHESVDAFGGKRFLIFATHDKGRGMDYYEVCEGLFAVCRRAESPYVLEHQRADALITVRAIDLAGNVRSAHLYTPRAIIRYGMQGILAILTLVIFSALAHRFRAGKS